MCPRSFLGSAGAVPTGLRRVEKGRKQIRAGVQHAAWPFHRAKGSIGAFDPGLFTVPQDQLVHLKIGKVAKTSWGVAIHTTGTVDWDQDHTTQAITQVNGPITRILVDVGTPVKKDEPLLYVSSPDVANAIAAYRKARNREQFNKRIVDRMKEMLDHGVV